MYINGINTKPCSADDFLDLICLMDKYETTKTVTIDRKDKVIKGNDGVTLVIAPFHDFDYLIVHGDDGDYVQVTGPFSFQIRFFKQVML